MTYNRTLREIYPHHWESLSLYEKVIQQMIDTEHVWPLENNTEIHLANIRCLDRLENN